MNMQMSLESEEEREFERKNKLIDDLSLREYNAFWVNNLDRLVELFSQISANDIADIEETEVIESEWGIPAYQYYKQHKKIQSTAIFPVPYGVKMLPIVMFESRLKCLFRLKIFFKFPLLIVNRTNYTMLWVFSINNQILFEPIKANKI